MNTELQESLEELINKIIKVSDLVTSVVEAEVKKPPAIINANSEVEAIVARYASLLGQIPELERDQVERTFGRKVMDLRRLGSKLPALQYGKAIPTATKDPFGAGLPFSEEKSTPRPLTDPFAIVPPKRPKEDTGFSAGKDVESWCGPCGDMMEHTIVAMMDGLPKQVICISCGAKHNYRTEPVKKKTKKVGPASSTDRHKMSQGQAAAQRKEDIKFSLQKELMEATDVRLFNKRERYRAGQIIEHETHGRGKIENILKGSLLVRFRDGLKSVSTF